VKQSAGISVSERESQCRSLEAAGFSAEDCLEKFLLQGFRHVREPRIQGIRGKLCVDHRVHLSNRILHAHGIGWIKTEARQDRIQIGIGSSLTFATCPVTLLLIMLANCDTFRRAYLSSSAFVKSAACASRSPKGVRPQRVSMSLRIEVVS
jgi:hypothetical protein